MADESGKELPYTVGLAAVAVAAIVGLSFCHFSTVPPLPARPPAPTFNGQAFQKMDRESAYLYKSNIDEDATTYGAPKISVDELAKAFPYESSEVTTKLAPGGAAVDTGMLRVSLRQGPLERRSHAGSMKSDYLILTIENKTDSPVAYRVKTSVGNDQSCLAKAVMTQNALAIPAHGKVERSECFATAGRTISLQSIEAMKIPILSYFYVSRLEPQHIGLDPRTAQGHAAPAGGICTTIPQQLIVIGTEKGTVTWRDVVDFYARHRCETYDFPLGYRAVVEGQHITLPFTAAQVTPGR